MKLIKTSIPEVIILEPAVHSDFRGWFMETYSKSLLDELGIKNDFVQDNHSFTKLKHTLRGIHFQNEPMEQAKLVRVVKGEVMDVTVDLRKGSPTYLKYVSVILSKENKHQLFIPRGFGHAFLTLTDNVEVVYKCDNVYSKEHDRSIVYDDPDINIDWGVVHLILSEKDLNAPLLKNSDCNFKYKRKI